MLNNRLSVLWLKLKVEKDTRFQLVLPISLYAFTELFDSVSDLLTIVGLFAPKARNLRKLADLLNELLNSFKSSEPYDLVDVAADEVQVSLKIR